MTGFWDGNFHSRSFIYQDALMMKKVGNRKGAIDIKN
jgi:hypothetical protein